MICVYVCAFRPRLDGLASEVTGKKPTGDVTGTLQSVTGCSHVVPCVRAMVRVEGNLVIMCRPS